MCNYREKWFSRGPTGDFKSHRILPAKSIMEVPRTNRSTQVSCYHCPGHYRHATPSTSKGFASVPKPRPAVRKSRHVSHHPFRAHHFEAASNPGPSKQTSALRPFARSRQATNWFPLMSCPTVPMQTLTTPSPSSAVKQLSATASRTLRSKTAHSRTSTSCQLMPTGRSMALRTLLSFNCMMRFRSPSTASQEAQSRPVPKPSSPGTPRTPCRCTGDEVRSRNRRCGKYAASQPRPRSRTASHT